MDTFCVSELRAATAFAVCALCTHYCGIINEWNGENLDSTVAVSLYSIVCFFSIHLDDGEWNIIRWQLLRAVFEWHMFWKYLFGAKESAMCIWKVNHHVLFLFSSNKKPKSWVTAATKMWHGAFERHSSLNCFTFLHMSVMIAFQQSKSTTTSKCKCDHSSFSRSQHVTSGWLKRCAQCEHKDNLQQWGINTHRNPREFSLLNLQQWDVAGSRYKNWCYAKYMGRLHNAHAHHRRCRMRFFIAWA